MGETLEARCPWGLDSPGFLSAGAAVALTSPPHSGRVLLTRSTTQGFANSLTVATWGSCGYCNTKISVVCVSWEVPIPHAAADVRPLLRVGPLHLHPLHAARLLQRSHFGATCCEPKRTSRPRCCGGRG